MTREEAIEVYNGLINEKIKAAFEFFAPELRESEDERVRKSIVATIEQCTDILDPKNQKRMLDWLEKQKENPKNADSIPADCVSDAKCEDRSLKHTDSFGTDIRDTPAYWRGWDDAMKQKEQKPAEKQDWSEEDDATIKSAVHWLEKYLSTIGAKDVSSATQDGILTVKVTITNLKSLRPRPSWKPSEEQMNRLCAVVDAAIRKHNESVSGYEPARVLKSLYEYLKKL